MTSGPRGARALPTTNYQLPTTMKNYPEESRAWDIAECIVFGAICVAGAAASIYYAAYFIVTLIGG